MASAPTLRPIFVALQSLALVLAACASSAGSSDPSAPPAPSDSEQAPNAEAAASSAPAAPGAASDEAAREWSTDDQGRRYYVAPYPKSYPHRRIDERQVRTVWGVTIDLEREDETNFYYRVYEVVAAPEMTPLRPKGPTEEVRASYRVDVLRTERVALAPFDAGLPRSGQWRNGFAVADMDGDGKLDIVHGAPRKGTRGPMIFLGDGAGNWRRWQAQFPAFPYDYGDAAAGDLDGDGRMDVALGVHLKGIVALVQSQPGSFQLWNEGLPWTARGQAPGFSSRAIDLVDWNADGRLDIVALGEGPTMQVARDTASTGAPSMGLKVFVNLGGGKWSEEAVLDPASGLFGDSLAFADVDGDKRVDALAGSNTMSLSGVIVRSAAPEDSRQVRLEPFRGRTYARATTAADFDGDGDADLAVAFMSFELGEWMSGIDVYLGQDGGGFDRRLVYVESGNRGIWALDAADVDGDGRPDLGALTGDGELIVLLGEGGGAFARNAAPVAETARGCRGYHLRLVDLEGDGRADVVAGFAGEPGGFPGVIEEPGCSDGGSLRAWRSVKASAPAGVDK